MALEKRFEKVLRFGNISSRSAGLVIPIHWEMPFQTDSHGVVGTTIPGSKMSGLELSSVFGYCPRIFPPSTAPPATK